jgi:hypothetical protein
MDNKVSAIEVDYSWRPKKGQGGGTRSIDFAPNEEIKFPKIKYQNKLINSITREVSHPAEKDIKDSIKKYGIRESRSLQEILTSLKSKELQMLIEGMMGGIELAKYDGIDFTPPEGAREAAKRALDVREGKPASQRGMTPVGIARARDLQNGVKLSPDTVKRMLNFLTRHEVDKKGSTWDEQGKGWQAWHGWGGDAGFSWAKKIVGQMEARDKKELARPVSQTPAPPKERIKGSKENPEGTASTRSKAGDIEISAENEEALKNKIAEFKDKHPSRKAPTLGALKKVFRRGAGAFSTSFRPTITGGRPNSRNAWAMARVNKFLKMAGGGEVKESYRKADGDLLEERFDCGTGAGGFKEGNTCAGGGGGDNEQEDTNSVYDRISKVTPTEYKKHKLEKVEKFETSIRDKNIEYGAGFDKNGNSVIEHKGDRGSIKMSVKEVLGLEEKGVKIYSHNHPSNIGLSPQDYEFASSANLDELRAVGTTHTYTIKRPNEGWSNMQRIYGIYNETSRDLEKEYKNGKISAFEFSRVFPIMAMDRAKKELGIEYEYTRKR